MKKSPSAAAQSTINSAFDTILAALGNKNEMQSVQPTSQDSNITIPMKVLGASRAAAAYLPNCAHTLLSSSSLLLLPPSSSPLSCFCLNGCHHCSPSFLLYLHLAAFHRAEVLSRRTDECGRHSLLLTHYCGVAPRLCLLLSLCLGYDRGDKTSAKTLTVSRPPQPRFESFLCSNQEMLRRCCGTGPKNLRPRDENHNLRRRRLTCGNTAIPLPLMVLLVLAHLPYPADYSNLNQ